MGCYVTRVLGDFYDFGVVEEVKPESVRQPARTYDQQCVHGFGKEISRTVVQVEKAMR